MIRAATSFNPARRRRWSLPWPSLRAARGTVALVLDADERYRRGHPALRNRVMFGFYPATAPETAFLNLQDPNADEATIRRAVAAGFIVRTRADAETKEARHHDYSRLDAALRSGVQISVPIIMAAPKTRCTSDSW